MDRVNYRRVTSSARSGSDGRYGSGTNSGMHGRHYAGRERYRSGQDTEQITAGETIITQCIISGVILVGVLLISILNIAPAMTLREGLGQVMTGATTVSELVDDVMMFGEEWFGWEFDGVPWARQQPEVQHILDTDNPNIPASGQNLDGSQILNVPPVIPSIPEHPPSANFSPSNPQVPGPSVVPGLWD